MNVQTVLGPIALGDLGRTLMHEHLFISFPGAELDPYSEYDRPAIIAEAVKRLRDLRINHGVRTFVDPCPIELGRDVELMAEISEKSEMNIVCTTGFYFEARGLPTYWRDRSAEEIAEFYVTELEKGVIRTSIRPGAIKCGTGAPTVTDFEHKFLKAASMAQKATGVPIITHTQNGLCGPEQQEAFRRNGVELHRCLIGHCCGNADGAYHRRVVEAGSYIGFDRIGYNEYMPDKIRADGIARLVKDGSTAQVILSQDRFCAWRGRLPVPFVFTDSEIDQMKAEGAWPPHYSYLFTGFLPMLRERGIREADISTMLDENPRRFFSGEKLPTRT